MSNNLRDRGFPQSRSYRENASDKRNTPLTSNTPTAFSRVPKDMGQTNKSPNDDLMNRLVTAYNNKAFGYKNAPLLTRNGTDYVTDDTDERAYLSGLDLRNRNGNRLAFTSKNVRPDRTEYYAGIDNLPFGANEFDKTLNTPLGSFNANYDGDGTASIGYETTPNVYYLKALANILLNRGTI